MRHPLSPRSRFRWLCIAAVVVGFVVGIGGSVFAPRRAMETHEIFVAQTARQMLAGHEWVLPSFNDKLRLNKPPLTYWAVMSVKLASGAPDVLPWVARLPSAFASAIMAFATVWLGRSLVNASVGLVAAFIGCGSLGWVSYANNARPEMLYAALCTVMLAAFAAVWRRAAGDEAVDTRAPVASASTTWIAVLGWLAAGLAIMTKGPQLPVVLLLGFAAFAFIERKPRRLLALRPFFGLPLMLLVPVPWVVAVLSRAPGGWKAWTTDLFAGRAGETNVSLWDWLDPYYAYGIPGLLAPWCVLLPLGLWWALRRSESIRPARWGGRMAVWLLVVPALIMSLTIHRRDYYMLSLMPVMSTLIAAVLWSFRGRLQRTERARRSWLYALPAVVAVGGFAAAAWPGAWSKRRERMNAFAREAASTLDRDVGPQARIVAYGVDEAFLVYTRNAPVPEAPSAKDVAKRIRSGELDAVLTNRRGWADILQSADGSIDSHVGAELQTGEEGGVRVIVIDRKPPHSPVDDSTSNGTRR